MGGYAFSRCPLVHWLWRWMTKLLAGTKYIVRDIRRRSQVKTNILYTAIGNIF
jgi:hypothetical protein